MTITVGDSVSFKVRNTDSNDKFCQYQPPPINNLPSANIRFNPGVTGNAWQSFPESGRDKRPEGEWQWRYYGDNPKIDCGITIEKTVRWDNGRWQYFFDAANGHFFLYVICECYYSTYIVPTIVSVYYSTYTQ